MTVTMSIDSSPGQYVDVAVVGAGIAGLTFAVELTALRPELRIAVLESADQPGGQVRTTVANGYTFEHGPTCMLGSPAVLHLLQTIGLTGRIRTATDDDQGTFLWSRGALHAVPHDPVAAACSGVVSGRGRLRAFAEPWCGRGPARESESVAAFVARRFGTEAAELSRAAVAGMTGGDAWTTDLQSLLPHLWKADQVAGDGSLLLQAWRQRRSMHHRPRLVPPRRITISDGGLAVVIAALAARLRPCVEYGSEVTSLSAGNGRYRLTVGTDRTLTASTVVLAVPASAAAALLRRLDAPSAAALAGLTTGGMRVIGLGYPLDAAPSGWPGFGFLAVPGHGLSIAGATTTSQALPGQAPAGRMLVRAFLSGTSLPGVFDLSLDQATALATKDLRQALHLDGDPEPVGNACWPSALPQYPTGAAAVISTVTERLARRSPGVRLLGGSFFGIGLENTIRSATALTRSLVGGPDIRTDHPSDDQHLERTLP